jgi:hypothetical protein
MLFGSIQRVTIREPGGHRKKAEVVFVEDLGSQIAAPSSQNLNQRQSE